MTPRHTCALGGTEARNGRSKALAGLPGPLLEASMKASECELWPDRFALRISRYEQTLEIVPFVKFFNTLLILLAGRPV